MISHTEFEAATEGNDAFSCAFMSRRAGDGLKLSMNVMSASGRAGRGVKIVVYTGK